MKENANWVVTLIVAIVLLVAVYNVISASSGAQPNCDEMWCGMRW